MEAQEKKELVQWKKEVEQRLQLLENDIQNIIRLIGLITKKIKN